MPKFVALSSSPSRGSDRSGGVYRAALPLAGTFLLLACASPKPVLYPNAHYQSVGEQAAQRDIRECSELASSAGAHAADGKATEVAKRTAGGAAIGAASGAVGGAIVGSAGTGAAIGAASSATGSLLRSLFGSKPPSQTHMRFVDRCLRERGYDPVGWD